MCKFYDETKKLWGNFDQQQLKDAEKSLGHAILELLALHGAKIAQVFSKHILILSKTLRELKEWLMVAEMYYLSIYDRYFTF